MSGLKYLLYLFCSVITLIFSSLSAFNYQLVKLCMSFFFTRDIEYSYHVTRIPYADYRVYEVIPVFNSEDFANSSYEELQQNRLFRKRYGIKIEFHQSGKLGELKKYQQCQRCSLAYFDCQ